MDCVVIYRINKIEYLLFLIYCYSDELIILIIFCVSWISYLGNLRFI